MNVREQPLNSRRDIVEAIVANIQEEEFEPKYRRKSLGTSKKVEGWDQRLLAYYWPKPTSGYEVTTQALTHLLAEGERLARALDRGEWTEDEQTAAVKFANDVFIWGSVDQDPGTVTPVTVLAAFKSALDNEQASGALMNSGWTKVAAFASAHLENIEGGKPHVIWDSRVAASLITRLVNLDADARLFPHIGTVPGRGGTRPRDLKGKWRGGYQKWSCQIHGSALVREMRDVLNADPNRYPQMPLPGNASGKWTTRGVEMVLFMDGY